MKLQEKDTQHRYANMLAEVDLQWCWACGRDDSFIHKPEHWHARWELHRAHIVNKPRIEDRRVVAILCPLCHGITHGTNYGTELVPIGFPRLSLANLLWLKFHRDPGYWEPAFLQRFSIKRLPLPKAPANIYLASYESRRG